MNYLIAVTIISDVLTFVNSFSQKYMINFIQIAQCVTCFEPFGSDLSVILR